MSDNDDKPTKKTKSDKDILSVALKRFNTAIGALSESRNDELDDLRFAAGSPDNQWQWPDYALNSRNTTNGSGIGARPCLTINKLPAHIKQVTNDQRQNRPGVDVIPVNDEGDEDIAEIYEGVIRHIELISEADIAYDTACDNQVTFGEGYFRILTEYTDEDSFDQDIKIVRIRNSFSVYLDPTIQHPSGMDAKWGFITEDIEHEEFEELYPDATPITTLQTSGIGDQSPDSWLNEKTIRIAEYFYTETTVDTLNRYREGATSFEGTPKDDENRKMYGEPVKSRRAERKSIKWCKINGYEILEKNDWPGKYIPIILVPGNEFEVEGKVYRSGIVRNAKDAQRMYNYHASNEVEMIALAPKSPFLGAAGQFEGFEDKWKTANTQNWPYLEYNADVTDGSGAPLPPPQRVQPPMVQEGIIAAKNAASEDIKDATGQYNASLGQTSNERSAKAIIARDKQGDVSTFHYGDNLARAIRYLGRQLVDLIPKIYDTARIARIIGENGQTKMVKFDPTQQTATQSVMDPNNPTIEIEKIYNPSVGKYDVTVVSGPGYATKRQEALESMAQLLQTNTELWKVAGDLFVKNMDWPGSQELAKRLAKTIPPQLMDNTDPSLQQANQQIQMLMQQNQQLHGMLQNIQNSIEAKELQIKMFEAETKRIAATSSAAQAAAQSKGMDENQIQDIVTGILHAAIASGNIQGNVPGVAEGPQQPQQGASPEPQAAPPLDPNKVLVEASKHVLQANQHNHEAAMQAAQAQQAQEQAAQAAQQAPQGGEQ